jgi:hypothetical protein
MASKAYQCNILVPVYPINIPGMALTYASNPTMLIEIGRLLHLARFARMYAKKPGVLLPELVFSNIQRIDRPAPQALLNMPAFLIKSNKK